MGNPYFNSLSLPIGSQDTGLPLLNTPKVDTSSLYQPFNQSPSSALSTGMQIPQNLGMSGESSMPLGNESAQNSQQSAKQKQSYLQQAFNSVQALYSPMGGRPIGGSEDVRVKSDAYGRPYTVVSMTPTDAQGKSQKAETISFGVDKNAPSQVGWKGPHSWEYGSDMARDVQNATNAAAATEVPKIRAEQEARAEKMNAMGFNPITRERFPE
jgi:hypothetical protein